MPGSKPDTLPILLLLLLPLQGERGHVSLLSDLCLSGDCSPLPRDRVAILFGERTVHSWVLDLGR